MLDYMRCFVECQRKKRQLTSGPGSNLGPTRLPGLRRSLSRSLDLLDGAEVSAIVVNSDAETQNPDNRTYFTKEKNGGEEGRIVAGFLRLDASTDYATVTLVK